LRARDAREQERHRYGAQAQHSTAMHDVLSNRFASVVPTELSCSNRFAPTQSEPLVKLYGIRGHVVVLLTFVFEGGARSGSSPSASAPNTSQQVFGIGGYAEGILQRLQGERTFSPSPGNSLFATAPHRLRLAFATLNARMTK
jgi:hypothetical protein